MEKPTIKQIEEFIEHEINPSLAVHGGFLELIDYDEDADIVHVRMGGGCHGCAASALTLKSMITFALEDKFPSIREVKDVTDHARGSNPFY